MKLFLAADVIYSIESLRELSDYLGSMYDFEQYKQLSWHKDQRKNEKNTDFHILRSSVIL